MRTPQYIVKSGKGLYIAGKTRPNGSWAVSKQDAYRFDQYAEAYAFAERFEGTIEPAEDEPAVDPTPHRAPQTEHLVNHAA